MKIIRDEHIHKIERYGLTIDNDFVKRLNEFIRNCYKGMEWTDLTYEEICEIYKDPDSKLAIREIGINSLIKRSVDISELVLGYIRHELWSNHIDTIDCECVDYEDEVEDE